MRDYNRALDYVTLAMAMGRKGETSQAAKLFAKAIQAPDAVRAVAILEAPNKQAFALRASSKRVKADSEFDMDDEDVDSLPGEGEEVEGAFEDEEDDEDGEEFDKQFASVLATLMPQKRTRR